MTTTSSTPWEPSVWLRSTLCARIRELLTDQHIAAHLAHGGTAVTTLGGPTCPSTRADRSCDRCGRYVPPGSQPGDFLTTSVAYDQPEAGTVLITLGLCRRCSDAEGLLARWEADQSQPHPATH